MELINQHTKAIMEGCKERARDAGLRFTDETLEYIVTNRDLIELSPKGMIPTLYDYWVHDLEVIKGKKEYELYPSNPYETVINTRPPLSFYNDNNPDWLNVMIFYHVLAHIDFMQNNNYFRHTWDDDFVGQALADKRLIADLRTKHGRWVDYVIEFTRGINNLVGYYQELAEYSLPKPKIPERIDYFFDTFLQKVKKISIPKYLKEIETYNKLLKSEPDNIKHRFLADIKHRYLDFSACYEKYINKQTKPAKDLIQYLLNHSRFLNTDKNRWMKSVMEIVRNTALYFAPQMRTKTMNEGWATYWHYQLFLQDDRIQGHEVDFARIHSLVTSLPRVGYNPYAIGWRMFQYIEEQENKGKLTYEYQKMLNINERKKYNKNSKNGQNKIFEIRSELCDFNFINTYLDQDFVDLHNLVIIGERINQQRRSKEYYIKSKKVKDFKSMVLDRFIHPPNISITENKNTLHLTHKYESKQLIPEFIHNVMIGIEYLWGDPVTLETNLIIKGKPQKTIYSINNKILTKEIP